MATTCNEAGLEVDNYQDQAAKAPEVDLRYFDTHKSRPSDYVHVVQQKKLPFGWSLWVLPTLAAVVSALVIGAGVGGAPTDTAACTTAGSGDEDASNDGNGYAPKLPQDATNLTQPAECAERGGPNEHTAVSGLKYQFYCGMDAPWSGEIKDRTALVTYTFSDCVEACARMNEFVVRNNNGSRWDSLVFGWQMSKELENHEANCWLKGGTAAEKISFNQPEYIYAETPE
ncbi:hypothetical protein INS49_009116 [Diaporthe citri]|uniref:uncharacterized protein n=1 Tax=Diaporthe citri TaxID=83186 RepID=UPI001C7FC65D|nr:uncharacterized protein INS49_009116 [Diaporthe citri]KAG6364013.1 hypothetical protein INS49_009116 [Diaporthe citri]